MKSDDTDNILGREYESERESALRGARTRTATAFYRVQEFDEPLSFRYLLPDKIFNSDGYYTFETRRQFVKYSNKFIHRRLVY